MEQGIPSYTPFSKRSAAATALNKVLVQHVASNHEPGTAVETYPLTNNPYIRLYPKVTRYQIHGLLLQLQCLKTWGGRVTLSKDVAHWNSCIDGANTGAFQLTQNQTEQLKIGMVRGNQHISRGCNTAGDWIAISQEAKRKSTERDESGQKFSSRPQASKKRALLLLQHAIADPFPDDEIYKIMKRQKELKRKKETQTPESLCAEQKLNAFEEQEGINIERELGLRRGKFRGANDIITVELTKPVVQTNLVQVKNFSRKVQIPFIIEEIVWCQYPDNDGKQARKRAREDLAKLTQGKHIKARLEDVLGKRNEKQITQFEVISPVAFRLGGAHVLISLKDRDASLSVENLWSEDLL